jgi:hypothetical protein
LEFVIVLLFYLLSWLIQGYTKKNLDSFLTNILRVQSSAVLQELQEKRVIALILKGLAIPPQARINITYNQEEHYKINE